MSKTYSHAIRNRRRLLLITMGVCGTAVTAIVAVATNLALAFACAFWTCSCWFAGGQYGYLLGRADALIVATRNQHRRQQTGR